jgi:predicted GIY-YIG superfamily endonuclease
MYYVGSTNNIERRLFEHQNKQSNFTHKFSDIKLVYQEKLNSREEAWQREKQLKGWSNAKKKALVEGNMAFLKNLSKKH